MRRRGDRAASCCITSPPASQTRYEIDGKSVTGSENVFAFRASWASTAEYLYVSDGKIRRRSVAGLPMQTVEFTATMPVIHPEYTHRVRDFTSTTPRQTLGIVRPVISPDGTQIAFAAVGDIYVMPVNGGAAVNLTKDAALDTDPSWSPDGASLVYSSDKREPAPAAVGPRHEERRQAARSPTSRRSRKARRSRPTASASCSSTSTACGASPRCRSSMSPPARITKIHDSLPQPGTPTWSPDGKRIALAGIAPMTVRFREGTNQVQTISAAGGDVKWYAPDSAAVD